MILPETFEIARLFGGAGLRYRVFGGNGVELVLGRALREHEDLDVFVAAEHAEQAVRLLEGAGFAWQAGSLEAGDVFYRRGDLLLDLVPIEDDRDPPRTLGKLAAVELPAGFLEPHVVAHAAGDVVTLTPAMHLAMKAVVAAYYRQPPREKDRLDETHLRALLSLPS